MKSLSEIIQHFIPDQASTIQGLTFKWLLAFAIDGVIWGKFDADRLIMYEKADLQGYNEAIQASYTPFRSETLQQMLIFGEQAQLSIWRDDDQWGSHIIRDSANIIDETQILWGTHAEAVGDWTFLTDGNQGMHHLIPLDLATCNAQKSNGVAYQIEQKPNGQRQFKAKLQFERTEADWRPAQLVLHHSIEFDEHGIATIRASRYVDLRWQTQGAEV